MSIDLLELDRPAATPLHFHVHLPRTAGSAMQRTWTDRGGRFFRLPAATAEEMEAIGRGLREALAAGQRVLVGGHVPYRSLGSSLQDGDVIYAAVREPVERAYSLYRYAVSMCQNVEIVNYPADPSTRAHWNEDWRTNVAASGLDPDDFSLADFVAAGLCPDDSFRGFFGAGAEARDLGREMRDSGYVVLRSGESGGLLGRQPVNRTTSGALTVSDADRSLLESRLPADLASYASILAAFPVRRRWFGAFAGR
jgi:hypothetical protein